MSQNQRYYAVPVIGTNRFRLFIKDQGPSLAEIAPCVSTVSLEQEMQRLLDRLNRPISTSLDYARQAMSLQSGARDWVESQVLDGAYGEHDNKIAEGILIEAWGHGGIEWRDFLADLAQTVHAVCEAGYALLKDDGFPGVFEYEVTEEIGSSLARQVLDHGVTDTRTLRQHAEECLYALAREFLHQCALQETKDAIDAMLAEQLPDAHSRQLEADQPTLPTFTPEFKFEIGDVVYVRWNDGIRRGEVTSRKWLADYSEGASGAKNEVVTQYEVRLDAGSTCSRTETVMFHTADEAFAAQREGK